MSFAEPSAGEPCGDEGVGGEADGGNNTNNNRAKRIKSNPRQSTSVQMQLKVIRKALERLLQERQEMGDILQELRETLEDTDGEIEVVTRMLEISSKSRDFQHSQQSQQQLFD